MTMMKTESANSASAVASALTPEQLVIVQTRAAAVPPRWQTKFLSAVGDRLAALTKSHKDISEICAGAHRAIVLGISVPSVEDS